MTTDRDNRDAKAPTLPEPVDVVDGIPDRSKRPARWVYVVIGAVFVVWVVFLIYNAMVGGVES